MKRTATSIWNGNFQDGKGTLTTKSGALKDLPYSSKMRFENEEGTAGTNPEELIGAAHAGCFNMALSLALVEAGYTPDQLETKASVKLEKQDDGFAITGIHLDLKASVPGIENEEFQKIAHAAKKGCPVSNALSSLPIELSASLK